MGQKDGGKWTAAAHLEPAISKSNSLLDSGGKRGSMIEMQRKADFVVNSRAIGDKSQRSDALCDRNRASAGF